MGIELSIWFVVLSTRVYIVKEINRKVFKTKADSIKIYAGLCSFKEKNEINEMDKSLTQVLSIRLGGSCESSSVLATAATQGQPSF